MREPTDHVAKPPDSFNPAAAVSSTDDEETEFVIELLCAEGYSPELARAAATDKAGADEMESVLAASYAHWKATNKTTIDISEIDFTQFVK